MTHTPSGQQAVDLDAALRWADRHEARERQKLRDMGLPPEGDMPVPGAFFVRGLVAMLRTAAPTAPSTAAGERERLEEERNRLSNHFGYGARLDGSTRDRIAAIDARLAALATPPAQEGEDRQLIANLMEAVGKVLFSCGEDWRCGPGAELLDAYEAAADVNINLFCSTTPPSPSVPWEEQAARQCEEWAIVLTAKGSNAAKVFDRIQFNADAVRLRAHARAFRALLSKPAKGEGK